MIAEKLSAASGRLMSLDVFRGATIAAMVLVNNPGSWDTVYPPLLHAKWHGWTFTDVIFPFFLWIVGVAMTLSFERRMEQGADRGRGKLMLHVVRRSAIIFAIGFFLSGFPKFPIATMRIPGVLQRIAVCYLIASIVLLFTRLRGQMLAVGTLLTGYWMLMTLYPVPGCGPGSLEMECNFERYVDGLLLKGHMWRQTTEWDPEGIVSTLPAIATTLFGVLAGHLLRIRRTPAEKTAWLFVCGSVLLVSGSVLAWWMPINKSLWTSSYSVFMAGLAMQAFAFCYWLVNVQQWKRFAQPFVMFGMNAIVLYFFSGMLARMMSILKIGSVSLQHIVYDNFFVYLASPKNASLLYALTNVAVVYLFARFLYRRKWFVRF